MWDPKDSQMGIDINIIISESTISFKNFTALSNSTMIMDIWINNDA